MKCMLALMGDNVPEMSNRAMRKHTIEYIRELVIEYDKRAFGAKPPPAKVAGTSKNGAKK